MGWNAAWPLTEGVAWAKGEILGDLIKAINERARALGFAHSGTGATATATIEDGEVTAIAVDTPGSGYSGDASVTVEGAVHAQAEAVLSGGAGSVTVDGGGSGYTTAPDVVFYGNGTGAAATAVIQPVYVSQIAVTNGGSGYTSAPTVIIEGGDPDTPAEAEAVIEGDCVVYVNVTVAGSGYQSTPTVRFEGGGGIDATAEVVEMGGGYVTEINVTTAGSGYTRAPHVALTGGGGAGASAHANLITDRVERITLVRRGSAYQSAPTVTIAGGGGSSAAATATIGGGRVVSVSVTNGGSGYTGTPTIGFTGGGSGAAAELTLDGDQVDTIAVTYGGSGFTSAPAVKIRDGLPREGAEISFEGSFGTSNPPARPWDASAVPFGAMMRWIDVAALSFVDHVNWSSGFDGETDIHHWTLANLRAEAGLHADGWTRKYVDEFGDVQTTHGLPQKGDLMGPWILNEMRAMLQCLLWTEQTCNWTADGEDNRRVGGGADRATAEADYDDTPTLSSQDFAPEVFSDEVHEPALTRQYAYAELQPNHAALTFDVDYYVYAINHSIGEFDANGDGVIEDAWHLYSSLSAQTGASVLSEAIGNANQRPAWPVSGSVRGWTAGGGGLAAAVLKWNVTGGFEYQ